MVNQHEKEREKRIHGLLKAGFGGFFLFFKLFKKSHCLNVLGFTGPIACKFVEMSICDS